jgi:hypothetical protein
LNWQQQLQLQKHIGFIYLGPQTSPSFIISSSLEDEELKLSPINLNPWVEDEAMDFQVKKPLHK